MLKQSANTLSTSAQKEQRCPTVRLVSFQPTNRQNKIFSQRLSLMRPSTKRMDTLETGQKRQQSKASKLTYSKNLFRQAKKVDSSNPRESFLPPESQLKIDNQTKIKILYTAYSRLHGKGKESSSLQKWSKPQKLSKLEEVFYEGKRSPTFLQPPLSTLSNLILNECNTLYHENEDPLQIKITSLHDFLEEDRNAQWINILCASRSHLKKASDVLQEGETENPYQLPSQKKNAMKRHVQITSEINQYFFRA